MSDWLIVDEVRLHAVGGEGADWWFWYRQRISHLLLARGGGITGDIVALRREDAEWMRDYMIAKGVPSAALKVTRHLPRALVDS